MAEPVKLGPFLGINNKLPVEKLVTKEGSFVRDAVNVDLTAAGTFQRRPGHALVAAATRASSLWSNDHFGYYVDDGMLKQFDGTTASDIAPVSDPSANVSFTDTPLGVVWTDGVALGLINGLTSQPLSVPVPNPTPITSLDASGALTAGKYLIAYAYVDSTGMRSALSPVETVEVPADGGAINVSIVPTGRRVQVFVSPVGGSTLYLQDEVSGSTTSLRLPLLLSDGVSASPMTESPMPGGTFVRMYRGRLLVAVGNLVVYSQPYNLGVTRMASNFIALDGTVTLMEPTQSGVFLATDKSTWFLDGDDITAAPLKPLAPYGAVPNTVVQEPHALNMWWMTPRGLVRTTDQNTLELRQDEHIAFGKSTAGAGLYREENGLAQVISVLSGTSSTGAASASSYMDAEVVN